ncbi:PTS permease [Enterococcus hirae]|nr:PTS permease [Enterococcus hirae]
MERTIILASHGRFASGILDSLELIFGKTHSILALDCYGTETFDLAKSVQQLINDHQGQELIIITDLFGGSVNNEFLQYINRPNIYLIAGLNLPLLIEIATKIETADSRDYEVGYSHQSHCKRHLKYHSHPKRLR